MPARVSTTRNVELVDHDGVVLAGFYQYGSVSWKTFYSWLDLLFDTTDPWIIVGGDRSTADQQYLPTDAVALPGKYVLLAPDHSPLRVNLVSTRAHRRQDVSGRIRKGELNLQHARDRDRKRLSMGTEMSWSRLQAAHICSSSRSYQHAHTPSPCASPPAALHRPGIHKSASLQNMLLLREDLHNAWADYEFGVDPDNGYSITPFVSGHGDLAGLVLQVDDIADPTTRPLDAPLRDHFLQGLLKHVKGCGERHWDFRTGALDLSDRNVWGTDEGKERLELELDNRLFDHRRAQA
ncbi:uncharacterized protein TRAVEDRAFT_56202 [Trametes versicolor FP-101664 SS1]|uniref:uncharacterized protein n=1 Tax=Trametes versicolor (strain FP-101664) TaxID=717944 RepID=UPI00046237D0|nr:uncharacterized protein TRAVEDRAFT_56202 [Trametes versicolor FP-101664 SS1]EIW63014.1 hypothetical protein TRAVEDRAFT_56202 [Trametes versicolor FP-101664 SS1]